MKKFAGLLLLTSLNSQNTLEKSKIGKMVEFAKRYEQVQS